MLAEGIDQPVTEYPAQGRQQTKGPQVQEKALVVQCELHEVLDVPCDQGGEDHQEENNSVDAEVEKQRAGSILLLDLGHEVRPEPLQSQGHPE